MDFPLPISRATSIARNSLEKTGICNLDRLPFYTMLLATGISALGFFFGIPVSKFAFWISFLAAGLCMSLVSAARTALFVLSMFCIWTISAFIFSYVGWDPATCHFPMAQALVEGWNPVLCGTADGFWDAAGKSGGCNIDHILCAPKLNAIASACISKSTGLFTAAAFLPLTLFFAVVPLAWRFAKEELKCPAIVAALFAVVVSTPSEIMNYFMSGTVDSVKCLSALGCVFAFFEWRRKRDMSSAILFWALASACAVSKIGGLAVWLLLGSAALVCRRRRPATRRLALASVVFVSITGASPYITQWIHGGSPFYPANTFVEGRPTKDLTGDFVSSRNPDALKMSWLSRVVYAWFSTDLAETGCRLWLGKPDFKPKFGWPRAEGMQETFRVLMCISLVLLPLIKNRRAAAACALIFCIDNLTPVKYVGFYRYFPEMYAIPFIAITGFAFSPQCRNPAAGRIARPLAIAFLSYTAILTVIMVCTWFGFNLSMEALRQESYERLPFDGSRKCRVAGLPHHAFDFAADRRLLAAGIEPAEENDKAALSIYYSTNLTWCCPMLPNVRLSEAENKADTLVRQKRTQFSLMYNFLTPWKLFLNYKTGGGWPNILFQPDDAALKKLKQTRAVNRHRNELLDKFRKLLDQWRFDIVPANPDSHCEFEISNSDLEWSSPAWLAKGTSRGITATGNGLWAECDIKCKSGGDAELILRGVWIKRKNTLLQIWADFESVTIDGEEKLNLPVQVWHDRPYRIALHMKGGEVRHMKIRLKPHKYESTQLRNLIIDAEDARGSTSIVDETISMPAMQRYRMD